MTPARVLITGGAGQLAGDLSALLASETVSAPGRSELDITDDAAVAQAIESMRPTVVFNCGAFHNVDRCESEEDRSFAVNARAVKRLAQGCEQAGAKLVHFSTNYVFDGEGREPYRETDRPSPRSVYAVSKLAGEQCALAYAPDALVVRCAGLYGLQGSASKGGNFITRVLARAGAQSGLDMVADQRLSPTFTADLAPALLEAVDRGASGLMHLTSDGECSWHEFATAILELAGSHAELRPVATTPRPGVADRPRNGVLARVAADAAGVARLPHWRDGLERYMDRAGMLAGQDGAPARPAP